MSESGNPVVAHVGGSRTLEELEQLSIEIHAEEAAKRAAEDAQSDAAPPVEEDAPGESDEPHAEDGAVDPAD
jgi:hypothetical protein